MPIEALWVILGFLGPFTVIGIIVGIIIFWHDRRHTDNV
jgi:hypothetical protein